ncbi:protein of unknown function [Humidesulfovibrio mexicanus]|uniref:DUF3783 domain-containing protein n=1 Tax=Humidesulfovibrio mexicanus TaxID=147047 RepID=A0A238XW53_9BACT|nr:DUF3783 domain-containing protein [Humidesulfovibrio mexicanus]SNR62920.1 protein of unknown function [Humidesulfovibrio mexicanus]
MSGQGFSKIGQSDKKRLYGPRALLVCGYAASEQDRLLDMLERFRLEDISVVFATGAEADTLVRQVLERPSGHGRGEDSPLPRAVVLSGITEKELSTIMAAWRHLGLPRQNWATLTPSSESWPLMDLLAELDAERIALNRPR